MLAKGTDSLEYSKSFKFISILQTLTDSYIYKNPCQIIKSKQSYTFLQNSSLKIVHLVLLKTDHTSLIQ